MYIIYIIKNIPIYFEYNLKKSYNFVIKIVRTEKNLDVVAYPK